MTYGEMFPRIKTLPGYEELAEMPYPEPEPEPEPEPPGLLKMAANLVVAVVEHAADGFRKASPEVQAERERLCLACDPYHEKARDACRACGCGVIGAASFVGLDLKLKRSLASSRCPLGPPRWESV
jgi:hypothetical protein